MIFWISIVILFIAKVQGLIHNLKIRNDDRTIFKIETFGFIKDGRMELGELHYINIMTTLYYV